MASDEVRLNGVRIGKVTASRPSLDSGRVTVSLGFKADPIGMMHAMAREVDK